MGVELAAAIVGFALIGWGVDSWLHTAPWGLIIGVSAGVIGGMYHFIRTALTEIRGSGQRAASPL